MDFSLSQNYLKIHYVLIQASTDEKTIYSIFGVRNLFFQKSQWYKVHPGANFFSAISTMKSMNGHNLYPREHWGNHKFTLKSSYKNDKVHNAEWYCILDSTTCTSVKKCTM